jgi:hypothetical protein
MDKIIKARNVRITGIKFLLTICNGVTPAISAVAITTPDIGEMARPILADNCIGKIIIEASVPIFVAMSGTNGPNE